MGRNTEDMYDSWKRFDDSGDCVYKGRFVVRLGTRSQIAWAIWFVAMGQTFNLSTNRSGVDSFVLWSDQLYLSLGAVDGNITTPCTHSSKWRGRTHRPLYALWIQRERSFDPSRHGDLREKFRRSVTPTHCGYRV